MVLMREENNLSTEGLGGLTMGGDKQKTFAECPSLWKDEKWEWKKLDGGANVPVVTLESFRPNRAAQGHENTPYTLHTGFAPCGSMRNEYPDCMFQLRIIVYPCGYAGAAGYVRETRVRVQPDYGIALCFVGEQKEREKD